MDYIMMKLNIEDYRSLQCDDVLTCCARQEIRLKL